MERLNCPKCGSDSLEYVSSAYPPAFECKDCKHVFVKGKQALIDE